MIFHSIKIFGPGTFLASLIFFLWFQLILCTYIVIRRLVLIWLSKKVNSIKVWAVWSKLSPENISKRVNLFYFLFFSSCCAIRIFDSKGSLKELFDLMSSKPKYKYQYLFFCYPSRKLVQRAHIIRLTM